MTGSSALVSSDRKRTIDVSESSNGNTMYTISRELYVTVPIMIIGVDNDLGNLNVEGRTNARQVD